MGNSCRRCRNLIVVYFCFFMILNVLLHLLLFFFCRIQKLELKDKAESESQELEDLRAESLRIKYVAFSCQIGRESVLK